jgi:hypothetical protein
MTQVPVNRDKLSFSSEMGPEAPALLSISLLKLFIGPAVPPLPMLPAMLTRSPI